MTAHCETCGWTLDDPAISDTMVEFHAGRHQVAYRGHIVVLSELAAEEPPS